LDALFGQHGSVTLQWPGAAIESVLVSSDGGAVIVGSHTANLLTYLDAARVTTDGAQDATFAAASTQTQGEPVGAAWLGSGDLVVWTSGGDVAILAGDGKPQGVWSLDVPGTVLAGTLDSSQRFVAVGTLTTDPRVQEWFVRRYVLF
jgi:hypothetical protein